MGDHALVRVRKYRHYPKRFYSREKRCYGEELIRATLQETALSEIVLSVFISKSANHNRSLEDGYVKLINILDKIPDNKIINDSGRK